ncbi:MAG: hypothetical protein KBC73_23110 [Burkholderiaceae bacterium]|nr:hypothetical protein [Burkholderiaceae bacterium]
MNPLRRGVRWLCAALLAVLSPAWALPAGVPADAAALRAGFATPPRAAAPMLRWWWPGAAVQPAELERELALIAEAGFSGVEIQPTAIGLPPDADGSVHRVGTAAWLEQLAGVLAAARRLGLVVDLTLGSSWPLASPAIADQHGLRELVMGVQTLQGGQLFDGPVPAPPLPDYQRLGADWLKLPATFDASRFRRVAVLAMRVDAAAPAGLPQPGRDAALPALAPTLWLDASVVVDHSAFVEADGRLRWQVPDNGEWRLFALYEGPSGQQPFYAAMPGQPRVLDPLSREAVQRFLDDFAEPLRARLGTEFGHTLRALFIDSLELRAELFWTHDFADEFARRRGYRIETLLPLLFVPYADDAYLRQAYPDAGPRYDMREFGARVRADHRRTVSELMQERFFTPLRDWAAGAGLLLRVQAHGGPVDDLAAYRLADIAETESLYAGGQPAFLKRAASTAHQRGQTLVSSEVGAVRLPAAVSLDLLRRQAQLQLVSGVNHLVLHGYPYRLDAGFAWPGWMPFDSPYLPAVEAIGRYGMRLTERSPLWRDLPLLQQYLARAQWWLRHGRPQADLAVLSAPGFAPDRNQVAPTLAALEAAGYLYDLVDGPSLLDAGNGMAADGRLRIGAMHYPALLVDDLAAIPPPLLQRLAELALQGLRLVFRGQLPQRSAGLAFYPQDDQAVRQVMAALLGGEGPSPSAADGQPRRGPLALQVPQASQLERALREQLGLAPLVELGSGAGQLLSQLRRSDDGRLRLLLLNTGEGEVDALLRIRGAAGRTPELWDFWTGSILPATLYRDDGDDLLLAVHLLAGGLLAVGIDADTPPALHLQSTDQPITLQRRADGSIEASAEQPGRVAVTLADGQRIVVDVPGSAAPPLDLALWDLALTWVDAQGVTRRRFESRRPLADLVASGRLPPDTPAEIVYTGYIEPSAAQLAQLAAGASLVLDLGAVDETVQVRVNGQLLAMAPVHPYRLLLDGRLRPGPNAIELRLSSSGGRSVGLRGPVQIRQRQVFTLARPLAVSVVVTPPNFPNHTHEQMMAAVATAAQVSRHVNFQWFWRTPPSASQPEGGATVDCDTVLPWVLEARRLGLAVTLQFQTYYVELGAPGQRPAIRIASPVLPFTSASFGDARLKDRYLEQIACLAALQPEILVLGPEMNFVVTYDWAEFNRFQQVYAEAYRLVKRISPRTQVGLSWQYDGLRMSLPLDDWGYVRHAGPQDFYALTSYYGFSQERHQQYPLAQAIPADYYHPIKTLLGDKPVLFSELGWSSYFPPGASEQSAFVRRVPELMAQVGPSQITWALLHDVQYFEGAGQSLNASGLRRADGTPKPAWDEVLRLRGTGQFSGGASGPQARQTLPLAITVGPAQFPQRYSQAAVFEAIATAAQLARHVSLQVAWVDEATGKVWDCAALTPVVAEVRRLGLALTLQWNTYATRPVPGAPAGALPEVLLFNPVRNARPGMADPPSLAEPAIREAWLREFQCIAALKPEVLVLGPEINFVHALRPLEFAWFREVYRAAHRLARQIAPATRVGLSYQYKVLRDDLRAGRDLGWIASLGAQDFFGLTMYFAESEASLRDIAAPLDVPDDYFAAARQWLGPDMPVIVTELGWSSAFPGGLGHQVAFLSRLPALMAPLRPAQVTWAMLHDLGDYFQGEIAPLNLNGLRLNDGSAKPLWAQAQRLRALGILVDP